MRFTRVRRRETCDRRLIGEGARYENCILMEKGEDRL